jgi:hypothetical protein
VASGPFNNPPGHACPRVHGLGQLSFGGQEHDFAHVDFGGGNRDAVALVAVVLEAPVDVEPVPGVNVVLGKLREAVPEGDAMPVGTLSLFAAGLGTPVRGERKMRDPGAILGLVHLGVATDVAYEGDAVHGAAHDGVSWFVLTSAHPGRARALRRQPRGAPWAIPWPDGPAIPPLTRGAARGVPTP